GPPLAAASPAGRSRRLGHGTAGRSLGALLPADAPRLPPYRRARRARPIGVLGIGWLVRLRALVQIDGREPAGRDADSGRLSAATPRGSQRVVGRARAPDLPREDPLCVARPGGLRRRIHTADRGPQHAVPGRTERARQAGGLSVRLEVLPLEAGVVREPLAPLGPAQP